MGTLRLGNVGGIVGVVSGRQNEALSAKSTDIASATTINLNNCTGDLVDVTGTTTITGITLDEGLTRTVRFTGALTLTNGASLVLQGGANITTADGDFAVFRGYASNVVRNVSYHAVSDAGTGEVLLAGTQTITGVKTFGSAGAVGRLKVAGTTSGSTIVDATAIAGSGTVTLPTTGTLATLAGAESLTNKTLTTTGLISAAVGTTSLAPMNTPAGTLKTTAAAGDLEFDGIATYRTNNTTSGRGFVPATQFFRLTATGGAISTIGNFFGATSNIPLVASKFYEIDIFAWFLKSTSGTAVWTLTNSAAPTSQNIYYEMSPATGIVAPPGDAAMLIGQVYNDATATLALSATAALSDAVNHFMHMKIYLQNGAGTSLKIQATASAGSITPGIGSYWMSRQLPDASTGLFVA